MDACPAAKVPYDILSLSRSTSISIIGPVSVFVCGQVDLRSGNPPRSCRSALDGLHEGKGGQLPLRCWHPGVCVV